MNDSVSVKGNLMVRLVLLMAGVAAAMGLEAQETASIDPWSTQDSVMLARIHQQVLGEGACYEDLRFLCKEVGPRLSGSPEADEAILWGGKTLQALGVGEVRMQPVIVPHWERGGAEQAWKKGFAFCQ